jgi:succinyl-diaminopimelate desuccinylase
MTIADTVINLCHDLIQTPSVNGIHPERAVAAVAATFAHKHGLSVDLPALDPQRPNLLVRAGPAGNPIMLFVAHLDTVAIGEEHTWNYPPFGAEIVSGRMYGRGAIDTKGGLAAALTALAILQEQGLNQPVLLAGVPDEESGATGTLGVKYLHGQGLLAGRGAIYVYPGSDELVIGHRGVVRLMLRAYGRAMHSGSREWQDSPPGQNAVAGMAEILHALEQLRFDDAMPDTLFAPFRTVITPTTISGGNGPSMVPAYCEARVDIRLVPAVPREVVEATIQAAIERVVRGRAPLRVEVAIEAGIPPTHIDPREPIVLAAQLASHAILGKNPMPAVSGPANESYLLNGFGIPTCIIGPDGANAHAADEYVEVESLVRMVEVYVKACEHMSM